jgi:FkbM family methyltransferase
MFLNVSHRRFDRLRDNIKEKLRSAVEAVLSRLPFARAAYVERDLARAHVSELEAAMASVLSLQPSSRVQIQSSSVAQVQHLDPSQLEFQVPVARTTEERISIAMKCRDADVLPKVSDAGAVMEQPDGAHVQIMHNGIRVIAGAYYGQWMTELIRRCRGHHEPQEEVLFAEVMRHLGTDATMLELGGYWSFYSIWFLSEGRRRRSVIVEPDPIHLEVGRRNARLNDREPVFINAFVGTEPAPPAPFTTEASGVYELPCVTVESVMESQDLVHLDILHCDAQGAELEVLKSCVGLAAAARMSWVFVSTHSHHISNDPLTHQRCLAVLRQSGATILAEHDVQESFSGDGLIVAKFGRVPPGWQAPSLSYNRYSESLFRNPLYDLAARQAQDATN